MTDNHLRILRLVANKRQQDVDDHDEIAHTDEAGAADHRRRLRQVAIRTRDRVAEAEARRGRA